MEPEQRGRASRASSTSSLGREVRCGCQYYQSDSLLPERRALLGRPPSRTMQQPPAVRCSEHEYEPIAVPSPSPKPATAPVVRITDTDVVHVADSDDSIDDRSRLPPELTRDGDVVLPLDGKIEDSAMEGRELGETGDTSEEIETPQQLQERLEERFLSSATPGAESRTDGEVNTSQVDSLALEELPLRRGARGLPQRLKTQAGKLRTRLRNIQRPTFAFTERQKTEKSRSSSGTRSDRSRGEKRPSRMDRIRTSISEKTKFNLPNRPRFSLPDRSSFHLPERPKFQLPEKAKFSMKKPNIRLPNALTRNAKKTGPADEQRSSEATIGSKKNIFDFSTYPRIFDKKSKSRGEYATSTPKDSRAQSAESGTYPGARKRSEKWKERFERTSAYIGEDPSNGETAVERSQPWRHPSMEAPRLSISEQGTTSIPWEEKMRDEEEMQYMDYEQESPESSEQARPRSKASRTDGESYDRDRMEAEEELYQRRGRGQRVDDRETWNPEEEMTKDTLRSIQRSRSLEEVLRSREEERYDETFAMVDPRRYGVHKTPSEEEEYDEEMDEEDEEREPSSAQSDREQQHSSTSSCDRRRRGVIEEIDSDEFFLRESGLSQEDMNLGKYLTSEIRDALRTDAGNVLADDDMVPIPPQRPKRTRSLRKQREGSVESYDAAPPVRPKRDPNKIRRSESTDEQFHERTRSDSKHRIVYQTEGEPAVLPVELLDDIVVVKPIRRKSRSSQRSQSQAPEEIPRPISPIPPAVPKRRKRCRKETNERNDNINPICNGHPESPPLAPSMIEGQSRKTKVYEAEEILTNSEENIEKLVTRLREEKEEQEEGYMHPVPVPPKRRSRSRGTSVAQDEDRTSHGAESLPEAGYMEEEIPPDDVDYGKDLTGYAIIEKREKPPRPPPPRRRKDKYATAPRSTPPRRPQRAYSTLKPQRSKESSILSDNYDTTLQPSGSTPYIEIDSDDGEHKNLRSDEVLSKMQRRPLPAPPRPPRVRKDRSQERVPTEMQQEIGMEITTATQTDPLPDDMIIEEVTQAKLIVAPSRSGSQIMVSTERIPSPSSMSTPPVPPLPMPQRSHKEEKMEAAYDTVSLKSPSPEREIQVYEDRHLSAPHLQESRNDDDTHLRSVRAALYSDEPVKIQNLEVGDLRVDRLSVSQIEAGKIIASEVDALVISASELKGISGGIEESLSPSIIKELIAIRSHLETVAASRTREVDRTESMAVVESVKRSDIPVAEKQIEKEEVTADRGASTEEEKEKKLEQKVVKRVVTEGKDIENTHTLSVARVEDRETIRTLENSRIESGDNDISSTRTPFHVQSIQDKSLRILDTESLVSLSPGTATELVVEESRTSLPTSATTTMEESHESRLSPEPFPEAGNDLRDVTSLDSKSASLERKSKESSPDSGEGKTRRSRSRSSSPISMSRTRQTASPVRSLPPAISVTPDTPDSVASHGITSEMQPQRAVISYTTCTEQSDRESQRESSQSPTPSSFPLTGTHLIAFPASQIPQQFLSLANQRVDGEPSIADSTRQLVRVLRVASLNAIRHFVSYVTSIVGEESREKIREVELTLCALLVLIAGLLIFFFTYPRTVTHHHHWDYFNPPK